MTDNPITEWWVSLKGDRRDLEDAVSAFQMNSVCRIELDGDGKYYLKSEGFNSLTDGVQVFAVAEHVVARINGAMKASFTDYRPVQADSATPVHKNGNRGVSIMVPLSTIEIRGSRPTVKVSGTPPPEPRPSDAEIWLELSEADDDVADALYLLSRDPNWFDLYKAFEVVRAALGGQGEMKSKLSADEKDRQTLVEQVNLFTWTAVAYRHARPQTDPPPNPMGLKAAHATVRDLVSRYLRHQSAATGT